MAENETKPHAIPTEIAARLGDEAARGQLGASAPPELSEVPTKDWGDALSELPGSLLLEAGIAVVEELLPEWQKAHPQDRQPLRAVEVAKLALESSTHDLRLHARAIAKACAKSRKHSFGYEHRIAEAARALARAATVWPSDSARLRSVIEALACTEEHRRCRFAIAAVYDKDVEVRREILASMRTVMLRPSG